MKHIRSPEAPKMVAQKFHFAILRIEVTRASRGLSAIAELLVILSYCALAFYFIHWHADFHISYKSSLKSHRVQHYQRHYQQTFGVKMASVRLTWLKQPITSETWVERQLFFIYGFGSADSFKNDFACLL